MSANTIIWEDDYLVVRITATKQIDRENPRTEMDVEEAT